ncbi:MAG: SHOCT domain-containing protein [Thermotogae bacterium]|nr:SHOCT domain-containing protein [Thermotogota bacterium]
MGCCHGMGNMDSVKMNNMSDEQSGHKTSEALEILKTRYAKGEITLQEYEEMKKTISEN